MSRDGWTVSGRPAEWQGDRLREPHHTVCVHHKPLVEPCEYCINLIPQRDAGGPLKLDEFVPRTVDDTEPWAGPHTVIGHVVAVHEDVLTDVNAITMRVEQGLALTLDFGPPQRPSLEQARDNHRHALKRWQALHDAWRAHDVVLDELARRAAEHSAPLVAAMLDLHQPQPSTYDGPTCDGCDWGNGGGDSEPPEWPCTTVELLAAAIDVDLPPRPDRPRPDTEPPVFQHPDDWEPPKRLRDLFPRVTTDASAMLYASPKPLDDPSST